MQFLATTNKTEGFPGSSAGKRIYLAMGDPPSILAGKDPEEGKLFLPTPVFWNEESMDCVVHGVAELDTTE